MPPRVETTTPGRRAAYVTGCGAGPATVEELQVEPLPIEAAAILSGIYGFLADLPDVTRRRADVQRRRRVTDREIVSRFGSHWCQPCPARFHDDSGKTHEDGRNRRTTPRLGRPTRPRPDTPGYGRAGS